MVTGNVFKCSKGADVGMNEEIMEVFEKLVKKYTAGQSSSVTYETAQRLMEAVIYCIKEAYQADGEATNEKNSLSGEESTAAGGESIVSVEESADAGEESIVSGEESTAAGGESIADGDTEDGADVSLITQKELSASEAYQAGYDAVVKKVYRAKEIYDEIIENFEDYGCQNYRDTILKGIPQFFLRYDPRFAPQDHLLMLDYPVMRDLSKLNGVDRIYEYLKCIREEKAYLDSFPVSYIHEILRGECVEYQELFFGNICKLVQEEINKA